MLVLVLSYPHPRLRAPVLAEVEVEVEVGVEAARDLDLAGHLGRLPRWRTKRRKRVVLVE